MAEATAGGGGGATGARGRDRLLAGGRKISGRGGGPTLAGRALDLLAASARGGQVIGHSPTANNNSNADIVNRGRSGLRTKINWTKTAHRTHTHIRLNLVPVHIPKPDTGSTEGWPLFSVATNTVNPRG